MSDLDNCPKCHTTWIGDPIPQGLFKTGHYKTMDDANKAAASYYGWTKENNKCFKLEIGIYDMIEDRTVAYECPKCEHKVDRKKN